MKSLFYPLLLLFSMNSFSQNCDQLFSEDKFTKDKKARFYMTGAEGYKPFVQLTVEISGQKSYSDEEIAITMSAGTGKKDVLGMRDYSSLTMKFVSNKSNNLLLYFLFEDGKSFYLTGSPQVVYGSSVYFNKKASSELLSYIKTKKMTDIRFVFNEVQGDYKIPSINNENSASNQDFFKTIVNCINW